MRTIHVPLMLLLVGEHKCCWILFDKILYKHNLAVTNIWNRNNYFVGSMSKSLFSLCLHSYVLSSSGKLELVGWGSGERNKQQGGWHPFYGTKCKWKIPVRNTVATRIFGDFLAFRWSKHRELCSVACIYCVFIFIYIYVHIHILLLWIFSVLVYILVCFI